MSPSRYDVVVIGAGIHGAGVAQAAAAAGYSVLILEQNSAAYGTSSRSSKLIHGGLRYLETFQLALVRESLRERAILLKIAPELVRLVSFFIPVYRSTTRPPWKIRAGLSLYALLGGLARDNRFESIPRRDWDGLDGLITNELRAVFRYCDGQTDDAALTRAVLHSARELGAQLECPAAFLAAVKDRDGYRIRYSRSGSTAECHSRCLINAAGPWVNNILAKITPRHPVKIDLSQGAHIVVEGEIHRGIYYLEAPQDRRAVFAMPWHGQTLVGTTERAYVGDPAAVHPLPEEIEYLQKVFRRYFPGRSGTVRESFAGLRVLPQGKTSLFQRPRETVFVSDDPKRPRLITLCGGKLTGYRATAAKLLKLLKPVLPARRTVADTASLRLRPPL
jgi:glycerol-3-phosphate dehydrogenase